MTSAAPTPVKPTKKLSIDPGRPLSDGLAHAMAGIIAYAQSQAGLVSEDSEKAVHGFRKSVRRSRALLRLLRAMIPAETYANLAEELRAAMRETSAARDADVMVILVSSQERKSKTREALDALEALLREQQAAVQSEGRLAQALEEGKAQLEAVPPRVREHLAPIRVDRRLLIEALRVSHRRARKGFMCARQTLEDQDIHDWRKRVKELRYQLELLEPLTGSRKEHERLAGLAESLGSVTDLIVLRDCALAHQDRLPKESTERLIEKVERKIQKQTRALLEQAGDLFERKPKAFATRVMRGVESASTSGRILKAKD